MVKRKSGSLPAEAPPTQLLDLQDEERRLIARQLHDTVGQNMAALQMNLSLIGATASRMDPGSRQALTNCLALAQTCVREIRNLSYALYPPLLDELGFLTALRAYSEDHARRSGVELILDFPQIMDRFEQSLEIALFRVAQAGLESMRPTSVKIRKTGLSVLLRMIGPGPVPEAQIDAQVRRWGGEFFVETGADGKALSVILPVSS